MVIKVKAKNESERKKPKKLGSALFKSFEDMDAGMAGPRMFA
jgi:hypothetical protein